MKKNLHFLIGTSLLLSFSCNSNSFNVKSAAGEDTALAVTKLAPPPKYNNHYVGRLLKQPSTMSCWAAALTMLYSWHNEDYSISIEDVLNRYGGNYLQIFNSNTGISNSQEAALYQAAGLTVIKQGSPTMDYWYKLLQKSPLSITVDAKPPTGTIHALFIDGMEGDGTATGTTIEYVDPADGVQHVLAFVNFIKLYDGASNWPLQIIYWPK
jgi:hypothetical protein